MRYLFVLIVLLMVGTAQAHPPRQPVYRPVYVPVYVPRPVYVPPYYGYRNYNYGAYLQYQYFLRQQALNRQMFLMQQYWYYRLAFGAW